MLINKRSMLYWLVKSEPGNYSWDDLLRDKETAWDGVRNYQARNNLNAMQQGDLVLVYHSVNEKQVVGVARVVSTAFQDPTTQDERWVAVQLSAQQTLATPVTLEAIKQEPRLQQIALIKQSRLSVMPLTKDEYTVILSMGNPS